jgi:hypothetical protein
VLAYVPLGLRARVLALSIAELTRPQPAAAVAPPPPPAAAPAEPATPEPQALIDPPAEAPPFQLWIAAEAEASPIFGLGGSVLLRVRLLELLAWSSAASIGQARTHIDQGKLRVLSVSLRSGLAFLRESELASFHIGAGVRAGWTRLAGEPDDAANLAAAHFGAWSVGPAVFAGATLRVSSPVFLALELELDRAREFRAKVAAGNARKISPWRSSAALGVGVRW